MNTLPDLLSALLQPERHHAHLRVIETAGKQREGITELFATLALRGSFYAIAGGEWMPTYALVRSVRRRTPNVKQVLARIRLARPFTCYQVLDLLENIQPDPEPVIVLDLLHHFYNPDIAPAIRQRVLEQCSKQLQRLALSKPTIVTIQQVPDKEYARFFPLIASTADEVLQAAGFTGAVAEQPLLL